MHSTVVSPFLIAIVMLLFVACSGPSDEPPQQPELAPELAAGKAVVDKTCIACHGQGLNGAPILGNKKMWSKRLPQGEDILVSHAINGFAMEMMPPRGGNPELSDAEIRNAVRYMMSLVQD